MAINNYGELILGAMTLVFLVTSALAVYGVYMTAANRRGEIRGLLAQSLYWYGVAFVAASVLLVGVPLMLKVVAFVWRF